MKKSNLFIHNIIIISLLIGLAISLLPIPYYFIEYGDNELSLDPSWVYAINHFKDLKLICGHNTFFTYGPLAKFIYPLENNIIIAYIVKIVLLSYDITVIHWLIKNHDNIFLFFLSILILIIFIDSSISFIVLTLLIMCLASFYEKHSFYNFSILCIFSSTLFLVKFDIAVMSANFG